MATKGVKAKKIQATEAQETLDAVKGLDLNTVIGEVGNLQVNIQNVLANLSSSLTSKIQHMDTVNQAITLKEDRLKELYDIEKEAITIDDLRAQREEEAKEWSKKKQEKDAQWTEELAEREKFRKREHEEYVYATKQNQKRIKDEFDAEVARTKREEHIRQELLQREWNAREEEIAKQEDEITGLRNQVAGFDGRLKSEIGKAEAILGNTLKRQYEHDILIMKKDAENERKMNEAHAAMLQQTIGGLQDQIKDLQVQLTAARADARDVASQALQSASGRQVAEALQRVVDTRDNATKAK
jgi:hypothetical protein